MSIATSAQRQFITAPLDSVKRGALAIGNFFYGDEVRTKRSVAFSYLCISLYLLSAINASTLSSCAT